VNSGTGKANMEGFRKVTGSGQRMCLLTHNEITISCWPAHLLWLEMEIHTLDIISEIQTIIAEVEQAGPQALHFALSRLNLYQNMAVEEEGDADKQTTFSRWGFNAAQGYLWIIEEIMRKISEPLLQKLAHGGPFRDEYNPNEVLNSVRMMQLAGPAVAMKKESAKNFNEKEAHVIWAGRDEPEYLEYRDAIAIDNDHHKWIRHLLATMPNNKDWFNAVDDDLKEIHGVGFEDLFTTLKLLECWMDNPETKARISPTIPIHRLDPEHLQNKLLTKMSPESVDSVVNALTWNRKTDLSKHPLIHDGQYSHMFAYWFCRFQPGLALSWLYPYFYYGHPTIPGTAGRLRGEIFEEYLKSLIEQEVGQPCVQMRKILTPRNCPSLSSFQIPGVDIDLAVNLGDVGLIIDAKGGTIELPKSIDDIRWHSITPVDVYQCFEKNKKVAEKWDRVFSAVIQDGDVLAEIDLGDCETLIPIVVHSKAQPIMFEKYREVHECPDFQTETHSLTSLIARLSS